MKKETVVAFLKAEGMSLKQGAEFLGLSEKCTRRRIDRGLIPHRRVGRSILLWKSELEEWRQGLDGVSVEEALQNLRNRNGQ